MRMSAVCNGILPAGQQYFDEWKKQLVQELRFAQNSYYDKQAHTQAEEQAVMDSYCQPEHNGPLMPSSVPPSYVPPPPPRGFGEETGHFNTFSTQWQYSENHSFGSNKPLLIMLTGLLLCQNQATS